MYAIGNACPQFRVRTSSGALGPEDFRGEWLGILHCTRPCTPGCATCMQRFGSLALSLRARGCRLLVALDQPDAALKSLMASGTGSPGATWVLGKWDWPAEEPAGTTRFVVVDPAGIVRAVSESASSGPIRGRMLLDLVDRACGRPVKAVGHDQRADPTVGCVEWYDFDAAPH
jgi:hypothetical protein